MSLSEPEPAMTALDRARLDEVRARARMHATLSELKFSMSPSTLAAEAGAAIRAGSSRFAAKAYDQAAERPVTLLSIVAGLLLFLFRGAISRGFEALFTRRDAAPQLDDSADPRIDDDPELPPTLAAAPTMTEES